MSSYISEPDTERQVERRSPLQLLIMAIAMLCTLATLTVAMDETAQAHSTNDWVFVYNPVTDGDSDHSDVSAKYGWGCEVTPKCHHIVYKNWNGIPNDLSEDVFGPPGRVIVTPFGSRTNTGHAVTSTVVDIRPACASGNLADGGYRITIEARDTTTGAVLGRADLAHVHNEQVYIGQRLGGYTPIGVTSRFRYNSCYQVTNDGGVHVHLELTNRHGYACYYPLRYNQGLTDTTKLGIVGAHYSGQRAVC